MFGLLEEVWHGLLDLPFVLINLLIAFFNALVLAIATLAGVLIGVLPSFPDPPAQPSGGITGWLLWMVPLGNMLALFSVLVGLWLAFLGVKVALKWVKVL